MKKIVMIASFIIIAGVTIHATPFTVDSYSNSKTSILSDSIKTNIQPEERKAEEEAEVKKNKDKAEARNPQEAAYLNAKLIVEKPISGYAVNATELTPDMKIALDEKAKVLKERSDMVVDIIGNTCGLGSDEVNQRIGLARANNAREYLISQGVNAKILKVKSKGKEAPIAKNSSESERKQNRRVTFKVEE